MSLSLKSNYRPLRKYRVANIPSLPTIGKQVTYDERVPSSYTPHNVQEEQDNGIPYIPGFDSNAEGKVAYWLIDKGWFDSLESLLPYTQIYVAGGRTTSGGHVIDFMMPSDYVPPTLLTVTGTYWHGLDDVKERDAELSIWAATNNVRIVEIPESITLDAIQFQAFMESEIGIRA